MFVSILASAVALVVLPKHVEIVPERLVIEYQITRAARHYQIDQKLLRALVRTESNFDPLAVSYAGARGLTQVMPFNANRCGLDPQQLFLIRENLFCGAQILREEIDRVGSLSGALAVYNCGRTSCKAGQQYAKLVLSRVN